MHSFPGPEKRTKVAFEAAAPNKSTPAAAATETTALDNAPKTEIELSDELEGGQMVVNLVVDSGPIIKGVPLHTIGKNIWTIPEVLAEIKDKRSRQQITTMIPFDFKVKEPSDEAIKFVIDFARKTGDMRSLSKTDTKVIALAYMLEKEVKGSVEHLHTEPRNVKVNSESKGKVTSATTEEAAPGKTAAAAEAAAPPKPKTKTPPSSKECCGCGQSFLKNGYSKSQWVKPADQRRCKDCVGKLKQFTPKEEGTGGEKDAKMAVAQPLIATASAEDTSTTPQDTTTETAPPVAASITHTTSMEKDVTATKTALTRKPVSWAAAVTTPTASVASGEAPTTTPTTQPRQSRIIGNSTGVKTVKLSEIEDADEGWITAKDVHKATANPWKDGAIVSNAKAKTVHVGCITTDFAMQNVILQVGLKLVSADGMMIKKVKQWVLKCTACFKTCQNMTKLFCPSCGSATLEKVAYSVDKNGFTRFHYRKNKPVNLRGTKYSIPKSTGSRYEPEILLREDQLLQGKWAQKANASSSMKSMFGEVATEGFETFEKKKSIGYGPEVIVGHGRKNPNAARGRERRGKKKRAD
jgi:RNA-binding protein NOB1